MAKAERLQLISTAVIRRIQLPLRRKTVPQPRCGGAPSSPFCRRQLGVGLGGPRAVDRPVRLRPRATPRQPEGAEITASRRSAMRIAISCSR
jgi:hypothetical protein